MQSMKKSLAILLAAMLVGSLVSCGGGTEETDTTAAMESTAETSGETTWLDTLPEGLGYDGENFNIAWSSPFDRNECAIVLDEIEGGDIINESVYNRNRMAEEKLDISITSERLCGWTEIPEGIRTLVESGDDPYDAYSICVWFAFQSSLNGYLTELGTIKTLDLTKNWWDQETLGMHRLGSQSIYFVNGDINFLDDYGTTCFFFNKNLAEEYNLPDMYELVRNGEWTYDQLYSISAQVSKDVDGDGKYTASDIYGLSENGGFLTRMFSAAGENLVVIDKEGNASINTSERIQSIAEKVLEQLCGMQTVSTVIRGRSGFEDNADMFTNGQVLLYSGHVGDIDTFRTSMDYDFGIIPMPKFEAEQEKYYTMYSTAWATSYCVPVTNTELDKTGYILDVMGYFSHDTIYEAVIEKNVLVKAVRDNDSAEMLDLLFNNRFLELGTWGTAVYGQTVSMCGKGVNTFASMAQSAQNPTASEFVKIKEYYKYN